MIKNELSKFNPASIFKKPSDVLRADNLSRAEKIDILESWAYDEREKLVAEERTRRPALSLMRSCFKLVEEEFILKMPEERVGDTTIP